jgi:DNA repair protein RecO (recombination protein O)
MLHTLRGIVLHHIRYKESSAIVYIFTDLFGRQTYLANNIKGKKAKFRSNLFQPLSLLEIQAYHKENRELQRLKEIRNYIPYHSIPVDPYKSSQAMFLAEILYKVLREEDPNPDLYGFLEHSLQFLDVAEEHTVNFHLLFLVQLTRHLGFYPENQYGEKKYLFDMRNGQFKEAIGLHPDFFDQDSSAVLNIMLNTNFESLYGVKISHEERIKFLDFLMDFYRLHMSGFGRVRSLPVLNEIFRL